MFIANIKPTYAFILVLYLLGWTLFINEIRIYYGQFLILYSRACPESEVSPVDRAFKSHGSSL